MNTFELDQPLDLRLKALNLSRGFSHEPPRPPPPPYSLQQYGAPHQPQHYQNLLVVNNMMLGSCNAPPGCNNNKLMLATTTPITPDLYYTPPAPQPQPHQPPTFEPHNQQQQQQQQQQPQTQQPQQQIQLTPTTVNVHQHQQVNQQISCSGLPASPASQCSTPLSSSNSNICNPAPIINQKQRSLNHLLASPISSSFKSSSPPSSQRQPTQTSQQRNTQFDSSPSTPSAAASPMVRQHSLISRYMCKACEISFSLPETLRAHQESYCTKTNRNQPRSQSAGFALRRPADCEF